jgi:hypothetical protein
MAKEVTKEVENPNLSRKIDLPNNNSANPIYNHEEFDLNIILDKKNLQFYFLFVAAFLYCSYFFEIFAKGLVAILMLTIYLLVKHWLYSKGHKGNSTLVYVSLVILLIGLFYVKFEFFLLFLACIVIAFIQCIKDKDKTNIIIKIYMNLVSITFAVAVTAIAYTLIVYVILAPFKVLNWYAIKLFSFPVILLFFFILDYFLTKTSIKNCDTQQRLSYKKTVKIAVGSVIILIGIIIMNLISGVSIAKQTINSYEIYDNSKNQFTDDRLIYEYNSLLIAENNYYQQLKLNVMIKKDGTIISPSHETIDNVSFAYHNCNPATLKCQKTKIDRNEPLGKQIGFDNMKEEKILTFIYIIRDKDEEMGILSAPFISKEDFADLPLSIYPELEKTKIAQEAKKQMDDFVLFYFNMPIFPDINNLKELIIYSLKEKSIEDTSKILMATARLGIEVRESNSFYNPRTIIKEWKEIENVGNQFSDGTTTLSEHISRMEKDIAALDRLYISNQKNKKIRSSSNYGLSKYFSNNLDPTTYTISDLNNRITEHTKFWNDFTKQGDELETIYINQMQQEEKTRIEKLYEIRLETNPKEKAVRLKLMEQYYVNELGEDAQYFDWICNQETPEYYCKLSNSYITKKGCLKHCGISE